MPVFATENHTINHTPVFLTKNHKVSRIPVFSTENAPPVICLIFSTKNAIESHVLQQFNNMLYRLSAIDVMLPKYVIGAGITLNLNYIKRH